MRPCVVGYMLDPVVGGAAVAAEDQREQRLVRLARLGHLLGHLQVAVGLGLDRRPDGVATGEELVQTEGEDREAARRAATQLGPLAAGSVAGRRRSASGSVPVEPGQFLGGAVLAPQAPRRLSDEPAVPSSGATPNVGLDPGGQRVGAEGLVVLRWRRRPMTTARAASPCTAGSSQSSLGGRALQRLADDLARRRTAMPNSVWATLATSRFWSSDGAPARHRGRRADADDVVAAERLAAAADQQRDVRALATAVGVQLVEDQEREPLGRPHQRAVLAAGEQQLEHHVVGEQDVRRVAADRLALLALLLARVAGEPHRRAGRRGSPARGTCRSSSSWLLARAFIG